MEPAARSQASERRAKSPGGGRAAIVFNPIAGSGTGAQAAAMAEEALRDDGWSVRTVSTRDRTGAVTPARELAGEVDRLIVVGGDGTLREAIEGLGDERSRVELGFIPMGNANVAAQELGIPRAPEAAVGLLADSVPTSLDLGRVLLETTSGVRESHFLAVVGVGWDAATVHLLDRLRHTRLGRIWYRAWADSAYFVCGLLATCRWRLPRFQIQVTGAEAATDGAADESGFCAAFLCNFRSYGKGMAVTPEARADNGRVHYQARRSASPLAILIQLICALRGRHTPARISRYGSGTRLVIASEIAMPVEVDGDYAGEARRIEVSVLPKGMRILMPRSAATGGGDPFGPGARR